MRGTSRSTAWSEAAPDLASDLPEIDEGTAWAMLLGARARASADAAGGATAGPSLEIGADGSWRTAGEVAPDARLLFDLFAPVLAKRDLVVGQLGQSLDGRIATESGASHYVTGPADRVRLHRLRALVDAVIVGVGTALADDPLLSVRAVPGDDPVRVVIDPRARAPVDRHVFAEAGVETLWVVASRPGEAEAPSRRLGPDLAGRRAVLVEVPLVETGRLNLPGLLDALRARGLRRVLVEGGGVTVSRFLEAGLLDRLHVTVAPLLIGSGRSALTLPVIDSLEKALRPATRHYRLGADHLFDLDLRSLGVEAP